MKAYFERANPVLRPDTILWLEGDGNYTRIHCTEKPTNIIAYTLKRFEERFTGFVRLRRNALVNPRHIAYSRRLGTFHLSIGLTDGTELTVSRRQVSTVLIKLRECKPILEIQ